jgi:hypothetical protein
MSFDAFVDAVLRIKPEDRPGRPTKLAPQKKAAPKKRRKK